MYSSWLDVFYCVVAVWFRERPLDMTDKEELVWWKPGKHR